MRSQLLPINFEVYIFILVQIVHKIFRHRQTRIWREEIERNIVLPIDHAEIQKAIDEAAREATVYERTVAVDSEAKAIEELKAKGVKFTVCPDGTFDDAVKKVKDDFITQYPETKDILTYIEGLK